jgi:tyrosine-specific transport protein
MAERELGVFEGAFIISGTAVGAGILALPVVSYGMGIPLAVGLLAFFGAVNAVSSLMLAQSMISCSCADHLPGLAERFLGKKPSLLMSACLAVSIYGALSAYILAGGLSLEQISGGAIPALYGSFAYFLAATAVVWKGLGWLNKEEKSFFIIMMFLAALIIASALPHLKPDFSMHSLSGLPLAFGVMLFAFSAHSVIPSVGRFMLRDPRGFAKAVLLGTAFPTLLYIGWTVVLVSAIPESVLAEAARAGQPATIPLGNIAGPLALAAGTLFALFATFTSFTGTAYSLVDAMQDALFHWRHIATSRNAVILLVSLPAFALALLDPGGFLTVLDIAGFYGSGIIIGVLTPLMYLRSIDRSTVRMPFPIPLGKALAAVTIAVFCLALAYKTWLLVLA